MAGKILVVEDDRAIAQSLVRLLAREGYYVAVMRSAEEATAHLAGNLGYDLALMDVTLPGRDGFHCCRALRQQGWRSPVIMLTGRNATADKVLGLEAGADDYVTKPFDPGELLARIRAQLRRSRDYSLPLSNVERVELGPDLELDTRNRDAIVAGGQRASLTGREYELLHLLVRHPNKALDKVWMFQEIWGCAPESGLKALAVYVRRLREKIEPNPEEPRYILTVRGFGYKLSTASPALAMRAEETDPLALE